MIPGDLMSGLPRPRADAPQLAVIGAGVGACALVASLRRQEAALHEREFAARGAEQVPPSLPQV